MKKPLVRTGVILSLLCVVTACTTGVSEEQRLRRESDANKKTVEKFGRLKLEGETKSEAFGSRQSSETSASVSISNK
jgi:hypothetical protein